MPKWLASPATGLFERGRWFWWITHRPAFRLAIHWPILLAWHATFRPPDYSKEGSGLDVLQASERQSQNWAGSYRKHGPGDSAIVGYKQNSIDRNSLGEPEDGRYTVVHGDEDEDEVGRNTTQTRTTVDGGERKVGSSSVDSHTSQWFWKDKLKRIRDVKAEDGVSSMKVSEGSAKINVGSLRGENVILTATKAGKLQSNKRSDGTSSKIIIGPEI
ncbi:hypothetical protein B0H11DRAFT_1931506 [Mycena galericulata]|nr:hypothetical protein B0H11DRAFT_1931506 [Mycena galericulata]